MDNQDPYNLQEIKNRIKPLIDHADTHPQTVNNNTKCYTH